MNMPYCRFRNTVEDLKDCYENMDDMEMSEEEKQARIKLIKVCMDIAGDYRYEVERWA